MNKNGKKLKNVKLHGLTFQEQIRKLFKKQFKEIFKKYSKVV